MTSTPLAEEIANIARSDLSTLFGLPHARSRLLAIAVQVAKLERALDEISANAMEDAISGAGAENVVRFSDRARPKGNYRE
jgi:hypothetical protein